MKTKNNNTKTTKIKSLDCLLGLAEMCGFETCLNVQGKSKGF